MNVFSPTSSTAPLSGRPSVFLAGTIDLGVSRDWQTDIITQLGDIDCDIFNPRRVEGFVGDPVVSNPDFRHQVAWELNMLDRADVVAMNLEPQSKSPVSLMELGLHAAKSRVVVRCSSDFYRHGNVFAICERYGLTMVDSFDEFVEEVRKSLERSHDVIAS